MMMCYSERIHNDGKLRGERERTHHCIKTDSNGKEAKCD